VLKLTIGRFRLPRVRFYSLYWPLSERAIRKLAAMAPKWYEEGRKATDEELAEIEGSDLSTVWEPIWEKSPILKEMAL
jgi:hypothetical protein